TAVAGTDARSPRRRGGAAHAAVGVTLTSAVIPAERRPLLRRQSEADIPAREPGPMTPGMGDWDEAASQPGGKESWVPALGAQAQKRLSPLGRDDGRVERRAHSRPYFKYLSKNATESLTASICTASGA